MVFMRTLAGLCKVIDARFAFDLFLAMLVNGYLYGASVTYTPLHERGGMERGMLTILCTQALQDVVVHEDPDKGVFQLTMKGSGFTRSIYRTIQQKLAAAKIDDEYSIKISGVTGGIIFKIAYNPKEIVIVYTGMNEGRSNEKIFNIRFVAQQVLKKLQNHHSCFIEVADSTVCYDRASFCV